MHPFRKGGNFFVSLFFNMLFHLEGTVPAWILLGMHYWLDWPIWLFWAALALWLVLILLRMDLLGLAIRWGNQPDPPKANKNPYSVSHTESPTPTDRKQS